MNKNVALSIVRKEYKQNIDKDRKFKHIRRFLDISKKDEYTIDDDTWNDMDMDRVYSKLDRNYSTLGESVLYYMLRNPLKDEEKLKHRGSLIDLFKENVDLREKLLCIFLQLGRDTKNTFLDMMEDELVVNKTKYYLYTLIGKIFPIIAFILTI